MTQTKCSVMLKKKNNHGSTYHIRLKETPTASAADWFGGITIHPQENGETLLVGCFPDQSALRGFVNQLWDLNFTILRLERITDETGAPDQEFGLMPQTEGKGVRS